MSAGSEESVTCSICRSDFNPEAEGGAVGEIGMIEFALCPYCYAGMAECFALGDDDEPETLN